MLTLARVTLQFPIRMAEYFYLTDDGAEEGPIMREDLMALLSDGLLKKDTQVRKGQIVKPARDYPELAQKAPTITHPALLMKHSKPKEDGNPPSFWFFVVMATIIWPIGLLGSIAYLCDPKNRSAGVALFLISVASALLAWFLFF
jgi:hypothetical protein